MPVKLNAVSIYAKKLLSGSGKKKSVISPIVMVIGIKCLNFIVGM